ncbi:hypothetical protein BGZ96_001913 [Linnemannia gamsii]|uniref:Uncharacterized protein n=1 Tax=Linnemannia gamsii TaxID=64522 RepID=A0ABQ7K8L5_9FUNG|nr:hypothetical protein BGZ96_001913 [Linnemannia gamsii]
MKDSTTEPTTSQSLQHKYPTSDDDNNSSVPSTSSAVIETVSQGNSKTEASAAGGSGIEDLMSRGDVFAGVLVFSVGMLVLIVAVTFYFANGRSLRTVRRNRGLAYGDSQQRRDANTGGQEVNDGGGDDVDLEQNAQVVTTTTTATAGTGAGEEEEAGTLEKSTTFDPHSPSTARLIDHHHPATSVFAFLKGNTSIPFYHRDPSGSMSLHGSPINATTSMISKTGQDFIAPEDDEGSSTLHMPILTRIKARGSCKKKSKGMMSFFTNITSLSSGASERKQRRQQQKKAALEIARSASAIIIQVQEPSEPSSAALHAPFDTTNTSHPSSPLNSPGAEPSEDDVFSPIHSSYTISEAPPQMSILRLEMPTTIRSSSVVGLYGSAKSSPNGSMLDAASTRAIYCTSLKSAISFLPTESTSTLGVLHTADLGGGGGGGGAGAGQDSNGKEIVIATAGLEAS